MKTNKLFFWSVVAVLYFLILIRVIAFGSIPGGINQDGAMAAVDAKALAEYGTDRFGMHYPVHFTAWGYGQMSVLLSYAMIPFIKIWGLNVITARLPILLFSIAGAIVVFLLCKNLFGKKEAIIVLLLISINPWHFMQSRWALDCNIFPHMFILGFYFLNKGIQKKIYIYVSMIFFALCMYCYGVSFYMVPFFLIIMSIIMLKYQCINWKDMIYACITYLGLSWPIYLTMAINLFHWNTIVLPFFTLPYFENSVRSADIIFFADQPLKQLLDNGKALINVAFLQKGDLIWNAMDSFGTMYLFSMPFILVGIIVAVTEIRKKDKGTVKIGYLSLMVYWLVSIALGLIISSVNVNRINIIFYVHIIFGGIGISYLIKKWKKVAIILSILYMVSSAVFLNRYFTVWADEIADYFYMDFMNALEYAETFNCDYYYITPDTQYDGSSNVSEILTLFGAEIDAKYFQGQTDSFQGNEISYTERYRYRTPEDFEIRSDWFTAYIIRYREAYRYDAGEFSIKYFGDYCVAIPHNYAG